MTLTLCRSRIRNRHAVWTSVSSHLWTQRLFWHWTLLADTWMSMWPRRFDMKPALRLIMTCSISFARPSDLRRRLDTSYDQWTSYWQKRRGNLPLSVWTILSLFWVCQTDLSIMFDEYRRYYTTWAGYWTRKNARFYNFHQLFQSWHSQGVLRRFDENDWQHTWTQIPE